MGRTRKELTRGRFLFDGLPVELIHSIFAYLWAHQICDAFGKVSESMDRVLAGYDRYLVNFRSIPKRQFDQTCSFLRADQVRSLLLTDVEDTPNQCELFFAKFSIEKLVNLRSLEMNSFNEKIFQWLAKLRQLKHFSSLQLPGRVSHSLRFISSLEEILPRLDRLVLDDHLFEVILTRLRHLKLLRCHSSEITALFPRIPHLQSLEITLVNYSISTWPRTTISLMDLHRFSLEVQGMMNMADIQTILSAMPRLRHLQIDLQCDGDLLDGRRWEEIVSHLVRFDFRFRFRLPFPFEANLSPLAVLDSFRSSFWLDRKRWFVASNKNADLHLFTVPRFAPKEIRWPTEQSAIESTMPHFNANHYVETVRLSLVGKSKVPFSLADHPRVSSLILTDSKAFDLLETSPLYEQIRIVRFPSTTTRAYSIDPKRFSSIFPRLESLTVRVCSREELLQWIDQCDHLLFAHFLLNFSISTSLLCGCVERSINRRWFRTNTRRFEDNDSFQCAINERNIRLWMKERQQSTSRAKS